MLFKHISSRLEGESSKAENFCLVEKWRKIERPLGNNSKVLRVWLAWGEDKTEVKLVVKRNISGAESEAGVGGPGVRVRRKRSKMIKKTDTVHPRYVTSSISSLYQPFAERCWRRRRNAKTPFRN